MSDLVLVSHSLCPYVQRAIIVLEEKQADHQRIYVDLKDKPAWFQKISPLGKVPVLIVDKEPVFESAVICEFLEETVEPQLHPSQPLERARHRAWIEFASATLARISTIYNATGHAAFERELADLKVKFSRLNEALSDGPYFAGQAFHIIDAAFAPIFRYVDAFERFLPESPTKDLTRVNAYRQALASRPSVANAVTDDYPSLLWNFLKNRGSYISTLMTTQVT